MSIFEHNFRIQAADIDLVFQIQINRIQFKTNAVHFWHDSSAKIDFISEKMVKKTNENGKE